VARDFTYLPRLAVCALVVVPPITLLLSRDECNRAGRCQCKCLNQSPMSDI
jgi:hypothetical protein